MSLPHFTAPKFLKDAIDRYINFLLLKQTYHDHFLTPCYDFDLVWHTHQVCSQVVPFNAVRLMSAGASTVLPARLYRHLWKLAEARRLCERSLQELETTERRVHDEEGVDGTLQGRILATRVYVQVRPGPCLISDNRLGIFQRTCRSRIPGLRESRQQQYHLRTHSHTLDFTEGDPRTKRAASTETKLREQENVRLAWSGC